MDEIYRCSNCGSIISNPNQKCRACGYNPKKNAVTTYEVLLITAPQGTEFIQALVNVTRMTAVEASRIVRALPVVVFHSTNQEDAYRVGHELQRVGGHIQINAGNEAGVDSFHERSVSTVRPPARNHRPVFFKLLLVMALVSGLLNYAKRMDWTPEKLKQFFQEKTTKKQSQQQNMIIIVAAKKIPSGHTIAKADLTEKPFIAERIPEGAFNAGSESELIGLVTSSVIYRGEPVLVKHFPPHSFDEKEGI